MSDTGKLARQLRLPGYDVDLERGQLLTAGGTYVPLRPRSFAVLCLLARNVGRVVAKDELMSRSGTTLS